MRNRRWLVTLMLAVAVATMVGTPGSATHNGEQPPAGCRWIRGTETPENHDDDVYVCRQDVWIHKGGNRIGNLAAQGHGTIPSWNTTPPTGTVQNDAGIYATGRAGETFLAPYDPTYRPTFRGTFTGPLDDLAVTLYLRTPVYETTGTQWPMLIRLMVDDEILFENVSPNHIDLPMQTSGSLRRIAFVFNDMYATMQSMGLDLSHQKQHSIELSVIQRFYGDGHTVVYYDSGESPSGLIFNLEPQNQTNVYRKIDTNG